MVIPFTGARGLVQPLIHAAYRLKLGIRSTYSLIHETFPEITRAMVSEDYRQWYGEEERMRAVRSVPKRYRIGHDLYQPTTGQQMTRNRYLVRVDVYNPTKKKHFSLRTNVASDTELTPGAAELEGLSAVESSIDASEFEIRGWTIEGAYHKSGEEWD